MELRIPWREYRDLEKLIKSQKLVDQYVADQIEKMADENARYYFFLDLNKVTGDLTIHYFQNMSKSYYEHHEKADSL